MNTVRTVSDTKRAFYSLHTRPVASVYRRVVEELMVEIHLLRVNENFRPDPIFALGVVNTFDRFMAGYEPTADRDSIFNALCRATEIDPTSLRAEAEQAKATVAGCAGTEFVDWIAQSAATGGTGLAGTLQAIATNSQFKYSRLFAIGLYTLQEVADGSVLAEDAKLNEWIEKVATPLNLSASKIQRDLELYRSNLDKLAQAQKALAEFIESERRRQQQRAEEQQKQAASATESVQPTASQETDSTTPSV